MSGVSVRHLKSTSRLLFLENKCEFNLFIKIQERERVDWVDFEAFEEGKEDVSTATVSLARNLINSLGD